MRALKVLLIIVMLTLASLLYVHQQVELVKLSYAIESREKDVVLLLDRKEKLVYNLDNLTSPSRLEQVLVAKNIKVEYPKREQVISVATRGQLYLKEPIRLARAPKRGIVHGILDFIGMGPEAQAKER